MTLPPSLFQPSTQTTTPGTPELFKQLTGAEWVDQVIVGQDVSIIHIPPAPSEKELMRFLEPEYAQYHDKAPRLALHATQMEGSYSLHTTEPIERGTIVTEYLGEWSQQNKRYSSYRWGPIDALEYRNCGGMVEDGFPNMAAFHLYGVDNLPLRILFVALEDIPSGEMLVLNYGMSHSVKINYHSEYRLSALIDYFSKHPLDQLFKTIGTTISRKRIELGWKKSLELENMIAKVQYLYQTPSALLHLLLTNVVAPMEIFRHFDRLENRLNLLCFPLLPNRRQKEIFETVELLKRYFLGSRLYDSFLLDLIDKIRIRVVIQLFLKNTMEEGNPEFYLQESILCNRCLDAVVAQDRDKYLQSISESKYKHALEEEAHIFAREIRSPSAEWFKE